MPSDPTPSMLNNRQHYNDDDDDDFQTPVKPLSLSLNPLPSSTKNPSGLKPLQPRNGARPRKKPRLSISSGKENRQINPAKVVGSGCRSKPDEAPKIVPETACSSGFGDGMATADGNVGSLASEEPRVCSRPPNLSLEDGSCVLPSGGNLEVGNAAKTSLLCGREDSILPHPLMTTVEAYAGSIESRLLRAVAVGFSRGEGKEEELGVDDDGDFEAGTQLRELMELCSEVNHSENSNLVGPSAVEAGVAAAKDMKNGAVECPLCGADITGMDEQQRHVHTNACLDNGNEATTSADGKNPLHQGTDFVCVREFLRSLELSKYEETFIREEIDWDTLQWLTEEDLMSIGVAALGPRKKIVNALNNLRQRNSDAPEVKTNTAKSSTEEKAKASPGNKLITEYFQGPSVNRSVHTVSRTYSPVVNNSRSVQKRVTAKKPIVNAKLKDIPPWCSIPGTSFRVDAFRFLRGDCSHWFLTHFHLDHYQGLTKNFRHGKIYCSSITASLVNMKIGLPWERLHVLQLGEKMYIDGVAVTCFDANHCPGSVILLFEPPNGKAVLHTGDFRFSEALTACSVLQSCNIHTLILDTTYCNPQYDFPKQEAVIQFVIEAIQAEAFNPKTLFLIGSYTVGKERLFLEVARYLRKKVYVGAAKLRLLQCLGLPQEDMQWFTSDEMESDIHVVPMWTIASFRRMKHISNQYSGRYSLLVAFSPTGWTFGKGKKKSPGKRWRQGTIIRYEVPYSEHCSFSELREFVQFISPEIIIPSVNNTGSQAADSMISLLTSDSLLGGIS